MTFLIVLGIYFFALFGLFFLSRRNAGLPALGLTAGALLAKLWTDQLTPVVANAGIVIEKPPMTSLVAIILTLLPALIVMTRAPKTHTHFHSVYSSILFALLAAVLTYSAFANAVLLDEGSKAIVLAMLPYDNIAITICLVLAVFEIFANHSHKAPAHKHHK